MITRRGIIVSEPDGFPREGGRGGGHLARVSIIVNVKVCKRNDVETENHTFYDRVSFLQVSVLLVCVMFVNERILKLKTIHL